jgi:nitrate/TMAO reductase-like tetraheme cytochrome c subunit
VFLSAANPRHSPGFSTECVTCHTPTAWRPAVFDHARTSFPLAGAHVATPCNSCHKGGIYTGTPMTCGDAGCHLPAYNATTNPAHLAGGFSTACATCHSTTAWRPATFNHSTTRFPLTGAHTSAACVACHKNGIYTGTPTTCADAGCHLPDYNATTNPAHAAAGFPLACESCHNTSAWAPSTFNHTPFFPISAGSRHSPGRWTTCADCHRVATDFKQFSCIDCHEHSPKSKVDAQHQGRSGYAYTSPDCYRCHPQGRSE